MQRDEPATQMSGTHCPFWQKSLKGQSVSATHCAHAPVAVSHSRPRGVQLLSEVQLGRHVLPMHLSPVGQSVVAMHWTQLLVAGLQTMPMPQSRLFTQAVGVAGPPPSSGDVPPSWLAL